MPKSIDAVKVVNHFIPGVEVVGPGKNPNEVVIRKYLDEVAPAPGAVNPSDVQESYEDHTVDVGLMLQEQGYDPQQLAEVQIQVGSAEEPLKDNPVGFIDRVALASTNKIDDKIRILSEKFGKENVQFDPERKAIAVRKNNAWYDTSTDFLSELTADSPAIAGGISGAVQLGAVGSAFGPIGSAVGAVAGGTIGALAGKLASIKAAEASGVRTEGDGNDVKSELVDEFLWTTAFGAAPYLAKGGKKLVNVAMEKIADKVVDNPYMRETLSKLVGALGKYSPYDVSVWLDQAKPVNQFRKEIQEWEGKKLAQSTVQSPLTPAQAAVNPVKKKMADTVLHEINESRRVMNADFEAFKADPKNAKAIANATVFAEDVQGVLPNLFEELKAVGDSVPTEKNALKKVIKDLSKTVGATNSGHIPFTEIQAMRKRVGKMVEAMGGFDGKPAQISSTGLAAIKRAQTVLRNLEGKAISNADEAVGTAYKELNAKYSARRNFFDEYGDSALFNPDRIDGTLKKLGAESGENLRQQLAVLWDGTTGRADRVLKRIDAMNAALNTTKEPAGFIRDTGAKLSMKTLGTIQRMGKTNEFISKLPKSAREKLITEPEAVTNLMMILGQSAQAETQTHQMLMTEAMRASEPIK